MMRRGTVAIALTIGLSVLLAGGCAEKDQAIKQVREKSNTRRNQMDAAAAFENAKQAFLAGNIADANKNADAALKLDPKSLEVLILKTQIVLEMSDSLSAMQNAVDAGLAVAPNDARFYYYLAMFHDRHGDRQQALSNYRRAAELNNDAVQYKIAAAEMMIELSNFAEAESYLQNAKKQHPNAAGVLQTLGHLAQIRRDYSTAKQYFNEALLLSPDQKGLEEDLALACFRLGEYEIALGYFEKLLKNKDYAKRDDLQVMLAQCYLATNHPVPARRILKTILQNPANENYELWQKLMEVSLLLEDRGSLRNAAEAMIRLRPQAEEGYLALARYWEMSGNRAEARATLLRCPASPLSQLFREYQAGLGK